MYSKVKHTPGIHDAKQPTSVCPPLTYPGLFELSKISLEFPLHLRVQAVTCCFQSQGWRLAAGSRFDVMQFIACLIHRVSWLEKSKYDKVLVHVFHLRINRRNPNEFHLHLHTRTCHIVRRGHFNWGHCHCHSEWSMIKLCFLLIAPLSKGQRSTGKQASFEPNLWPMALLNTVNETY